MKIQALVRDMDTSVRRHRNLKTSNPTLYRQKIEEENATLCDAFPTVFEMHLEGKLDKTFFDMLKLKLKIEKGELTEDEASKIVGQQLFDRFVAPVVNNLPVPEKPMSYSEYYDQFKKTE